MRKKSYLGNQRLSLSIDPGVDAFAIVVAGCGNSTILLGSGACNNSRSNRRDGCKGAKELVRGDGSAGSGGGGATELVHAEGSKQGRGLGSGTHSKLGESLGGFAGTKQGARKHRNTADEKRFDVKNIIVELINIIQTSFQQKIARLSRFQPNNTRKLTVSSNNRFRFFSVHWPNPKGTPLLHAFGSKNPHLWW